MRIPLIVYLFQGIVNTGHEFVTVQSVYQIYDIDFFRKDEDEELSSVLIFIGKLLFLILVRYW